MANTRSPAETQRLLATARQNPRPFYYSAVTQSNIQISYAFETYLIQQDNASKRALTNRLRKSLDQCDTGLDRDAMAVQAARFEMAAVGAQSDEINVEIGDYSGFSKTQLQTSQLPEISEIVGSIGSAMGSKLFQRDLYENDIIAAGRVRNDITGGVGLVNKKKQIQSWITVITTYTLKA